MVEQARVPIRSKFERPSSLQVLTPMDFINDFRMSGEEAQNRVWLQCMNFQYGHASGLVQQVLHDTAKRGLDVRVNIDAYSDVIFSGKIRWMSLPGRGHEQTLKRKDHEMKEGLKEAGAQVRIINPTIKRFGLEIPVALAPFVGRNHTKVYIVDNIAWFGGVNVSPESFEKADFVVKFEDPRIVDALSKLFLQARKEKPLQDYRMAITPEYSLLVDIGDPGQSLILDEAKKLVSRSGSEIDYLSFNPPTGGLLDGIIERARSGVNVNIVLSNIADYTSNSLPVGLLLKKTFHKFNERIEGIENIHVFNYPDGSVHGKLIVVDGKEAIFGSHNFAESGVRAGTQEASMRTTDQNLISQLSALIESVKDGSFDRGLKRTV